MVSPSGTPRLRMAERWQTKRQPEIFALEPGLFESPAQRRAKDGLTVHVVDREFAPRGVFGQTPEGRQRVLRTRFECGERGEAFVAAFNVERRLTINQHHMGTSNSLQALSPTLRPGEG